MTSHEQPEVIDAAIHPVVRELGELRQYMREAYRQLDFIGPVRFLYPTPTLEPIDGLFVKDARTEDGLTGSDPAVIEAHMERAGVAKAVLTPLTFGLNPNLDLRSEICRAMNDWLADRWLGEWNAHGRFFGSIRVNPADPDAAVAEIERWADDLRMAQVAISLESHQPYGQRHFFRVWEAAAANDLPVSIHIDGGGASEFHPTANGYPRLFAEYDSLVSLNFVYHLTSFIAEGVFERLPNLRLIFGSGGHDLLMPFMWRMDIDWPTTRIENPWVSKLPTDYLADHFRFITSKFEGPPADHTEQWLKMSRASKLLLYGSHYPYWSAMVPDELPPGLRHEQRDAVLRTNAEGFLRLPATTPSRSHA